MSSNLGSRRGVVDLGVRGKGLCAVIQLGLAWGFLWWLARGLLGSLREGFLGDLREGFFGSLREDFLVTCVSQFGYSSSNCGLRKLRGKELYAQASNFDLRKPIRMFVIQP
jgi:hypothetical protein